MNLPAYPKYKPSGVEWLGEVPEHWSPKRGRFVMSVNPPAPRLRVLPPEADVSFVPMEAIGVFGGMNLAQSRTLADVTGGYTEFQDGDIVVAKITPCFENGKAALASGLLNGAAFGTTELHVLRSSPVIDKRYLFYLALSDSFRRVGEAEMYGAGGQKRVPPEFCKNFHVPLPPLSDQLTIAAFLDRETARLDRLVAKKRELIERLKEKRTALISRTVTRGLPPAAARAAGLPENPPLKPSGVDWIGECPAHWQVRRLRYISDCIVVGVVVNPSTYFTDDGVPFLLGGDVREMRINTKECKRCSVEASSGPLMKSRLDTGDVVVVRVGYPGVAAVVPPEVAGGNVASMMLVKRHARYCSPWLAYAFNSQTGRDQVTIVQYGAAQKQFNISHAVDFVFPFPPLNEQSAIAEFLNIETAKLDALVGRIEAAIERLQEYRTALITAAVTGKIDVRAEVTP